MTAGFVLLYILAVGTAFWKLGWLYGFAIFGVSWWLLRKYISMAIMMFTMAIMAEKMQNMLGNLKVPV